VFTVSYPGGEETLTKARTEANLVDALKWIDVQQPGAGTEEAWNEYLVRLEKDEPIIKMNITCFYGDYTKIRLRGAGAERKISHDGSTNIYSFYTPTTNAIGYGLLSVGFWYNREYPYAHLALQIEDKVTLDGKNEKFNNNAALNLRGMVQVWQNCRFIMEEGSKITGFVANASSTIYAPVMLRNNSAFYMRGGEISDTTLSSAGGVIVNYHSQGGTTQLPVVIFDKTGGVFKNTRYNGSSVPTCIGWSYNDKIGVPENDSATRIFFTSKEEFDALAK
jgi:hypothetical protein